MKKVSLMAVAVGLLISCWVVTHYEIFLVSPFVILLLLSDRCRRMVMAGVATVGKLESRPFVAVGIGLCLCATICGFVFVNCADLLSEEMMGVGNEDYIVLWSQAKEFAQGVWPYSKSWTTIVLYGTWIRLFGDSVRMMCAFNFTIYLLELLLVYLLARKLWGGGIVAMVVVALSPFCSWYLIKCATENIYPFFLLAHFYSLLCFRDSRRIVTVVLSSCLMAITALFAIWTRAEGLALLTVGFCCMCFWMISLRKWRKLAIGSVVVSCVIILGVFVACSDSLSSTRGYKSILCTRVNKWCILHGANRKTGGRWSYEAKQNVWDSMRRDHPDIDMEIEDRWGNLIGLPKLFYLDCEPLTYSYVVKEAQRLWGEMTVGQKLQFVLSKEDIWQSWFVTTYWKNSQLPMALFVHIVIAFGGMVFFVLLFRRRTWHWTCMFPVGMVAANFVSIAIGEVSGRYTLSIWFLWPILVSALFSQRYLKARS